MDYIKRVYTKNSKVHYDKESTHKFETKEYENTYSLLLKIFKSVGLQLQAKQPIYWKLFYWFEFMHIAVATGQQLITMIQTAKGGSFQDALDLFQMTPCVGYAILANLKSANIMLYRPIYENIYLELKGMWPTGEIGRDERKVVSSSLKQLNVVVIGYFWCNIALLVFFYLPPIVELVKYSAGWEADKKFPFAYWFPMDPFQPGYYEVILLLESWHGVVTIMFILCSDLLFCIFLTHITTQFDLLSLRIKNFIYVPVDKQLIKDYPLGERCSKYTREDKRAIETVPDTDWEKENQIDLHAIIKRHRDLIRLSGDIENTFNFSLLINFINSSIVICFCGFCCAVVEKWNEMIYKSFLITALSQTCLLCWYGQRLLDSSKGVTKALYDCGWYMASKKIKSSVLIIMHRAQNEVYVTTYGFAPVSLMSYTSIIKTAWSYFTLLLNIYKDK